MNYLKQMKNSLVEVLKKTGLMVGGTALFLLLYVLSPLLLLLYVFLPDKVKSKFIKKEEDKEIVLSTLVPFSIAVSFTYYFLLFAWK